MLMSHCKTSFSRVCKSFPAICE